MCAAATEFIPVRTSAQCVATMFIDNNIIPNNLVTFVEGCIFARAPKARQLCLLSKTNNRTQVKIFNTYSKQTVPAKPKTTQSVKHVELFQSLCLLLYGNFKETFAIVFEILRQTVAKTITPSPSGKNHAASRQIFRDFISFYSNSIKNCSVKVTCDQALFSFRSVKHSGGKGETKNRA